MKHLTFFTVIVLLTIAVTSLGFAGKANSADKGVRSGDPTMVQKAGLTDSDIPQVQKSPLNRTVNMATAKPTVKLQKYNIPSLSAGLSGTYSIPSGPMTSISVAVDLLAFFGASGDVTFELTNSSYTETSPVVFVANCSNDGAYNVTLKPATGVTPVVHFVSTLTEGKGFVFNGAKNITIDGLTIDYDVTSVFPTGDAFGATIYITNISEDLTFKNTHIKGQIDNAVWENQTDGRPAIFVWSPDADGDGSKNLTFDGCTITNATYAMKVLGDYWSIDNNADGLNITNCKIGGAYGEKVNIGFFAEATKNVNFTGNIIDGVELMQTYWYNGPTEWDYDGGVFYAGGTASFMYDFGQATGAHFLIVDGGVFVNNIYRNISYNGSVGDGTLTYGTRVYSYNFGLAKTAIFRNNLIYNISNPGGAGSQIVGLRGPAGYVNHNSIRLTGSTASGATTTCVSGVTTAYNNAFSDELTGPTSSNLRAITAGGTFNNNAVYSNGYFVSGYATANAAAAAGVNPNGIFGSVGFNSDLTITTGPSSAENIGAKWILPLLDFAGVSRDTSALGIRDAGAYEFGALGIAFGPDVFPQITAPPAGVPAGPPQTPSVSVKNNSTFATGSFDVTLLQTAGAGSYTSTKSVSLLPMERKTVTFDAWTPASAGSYTLSATTALAGDINAGNDVSTLIVTAAAPAAILTNKTYTWDVNDEGWTRTIDFVRKNNFTKLGGPKSGYSMVTERPNLVSTYTEGAYANTQGYATTYPGANFLISPWLDLSGMSGTDLFISFYQSTSTENLWDRSWVQYTTDGATWQHLGVLNDPNGLNWYNEALYAGAKLDIANFDFTTAIQYGLVPNAQVTDLPSWTTNADETSPSGWVYTRLKVTAPAVARAGAIRFRYVAFSDAVYALQGWAVDNFYLGNTAEVLAGGTISGTIFHDLNGDGIDNDASPEVGLIVNQYLFGSLMQKDTTDATGAYSFNVTLPATYMIEATKSGVAWTLPFGTTNIAAVPHPSDGSNVTRNMGYYKGSIAGVMFNDANDNGAKDPGEPGLSGWTVEVHKDSANGALFASAITSGTGTYSFNLPPYANGPYNYVVKRIAKPTIGRQTVPATPGTYPINIYGLSESSTANLIDIDFGDFIFAILRTECSVDWYGLGQLPPKGYDHAALPLGTPTLNFEFYKNDVLIATDALSNGVGIATHASLDLGTYKFKRVSATPAGWVFTTLDEIEIVVSSGGIADSATFMYFKSPTVSGTKYNDLNGNGAKDTGEPGLQGWAITLTGNGGGTATTGPDGNYSFPAVGTGSHSISEAPQDGWQQTTAAVTPWTALSGSYSQNNKVIDFGNFQKTSISGMKVRDRANFGVQDPGEEGLVGWTIRLTLGAGTPVDVPTASDGSFLFSDLGPGTYTLSEVLQTGWTNTFPTGGTYSIPLVSGTPVTGKLFLNSFDHDTTKYRTFTYEQLQPLSEKSLKKAPSMKAGAPWWAPNTANLISKILLAPELGTMQVGVIGSKAPNGKDYAYLKPVKQADVFKTFNDGKGAYHSSLGLNRGLDFDIKGGAMYKQYKSIPATKKNDPLLAQLLTLQVNLEASAKLHTPIGLGGLVYTWPTGLWTGEKSIDDIEAFANDMMTNWGGVPYYKYDTLYNVVKRINEAFANTVITDTTFLGGWRNTTPPKFIWHAYKTAAEIPFLKAFPGVTPRVRPVGTPELIPAIYALNQNYPNPFNPTTVLSFDLPEASIVTLKIYNVLGQEVASVLNQQEFSEGLQEVEFDASTLASGVYLYRIAAEQITDEGVGQTFTQVKKMLLMK